MVKEKNDGLSELRQRVSNIEALVEELVFKKRMVDSIRNKKREFTKRYCYSWILAAIFGVVVACFNPAIGVATFFLTPLICMFGFNFFGLDDEVEKQVRILKSAQEWGEFDG